MITWHQLGMIALALFGTVLIIAGALTVFGGMNSSAPSEGERIQRQGCTLAIAGIAVFAILIFLIK